MSRYLKQNITVLFAILIMGIAVFAIVNAQPVYAAGDDKDGGVYAGVPWRITSDDALIIGKEGNTYTFDRSEEQDGYPWETYADYLKTVKFEGTVYGKGNIGSMFLMCNSLTSMDLSGFDTSNVTGMEGMFFGCSSLTYLDVSGFDTSKMTNFSAMFCDCSSLTNLDVSGFDTSKAEYMDSMFAGCSSLTDLNLTKFDTGNVRDMVRMFAGCSSLTSLILTSFDTRNVVAMTGMFEDCSSLISVTTRTFDTRKVGIMQGMFNGCSSLEYLDLSNFDASNVYSMGWMFDDCRSLKTLSIGTDFNNPNIRTDDLKATFPKTMHSSSGTKYNAGAYIPYLGYNVSYYAESDEPEDPCGNYHKWDSGTITKKATCTTAGTVLYTCTRCGKTNSETIYPLGHELKHYKKAAGFLKNGKEFDYCTICKAKMNFKTLKGYATFYVKSFKVVGAKKGFTAKWKKQSAANQKKFNGYQIRYSLKSNMSRAITATAKKSSTSKKITKLKAKKTYYVQVRTYTKKNGTTFYSKWSAKKKVKTK